MIYFVAHFEHYYSHHISLLVFLIAVIFFSMGYAVGARPR